MSRVPAILFIQLFFSLTVLSQRAIKGRVVDAASGDAIPGSSVFINNSSKGDISDKAGQFEMRDVGDEYRL